MERELAIFKDTIWNIHRIRVQKDAVLPNGAPDHIYNFPEQYNLEECGKAELYIEEKLQFRGYKLIKQTSTIGRNHQLGEG